MVLHPVKICQLYLIKFNKVLIGQYPGKKYRQGDQAGGIGRATRTGEFWEKEKFSLQLTLRHRGSKMRMPR